MRFWLKTFLAKNTQLNTYLACKVEIIIIHIKVISKESIVQQLNQIDNKAIAEAKKTKIMERLQNEVDNTSKMQHQNIVKFIDLIESPNNIYFFMEYCTNGTLEKLISVKKRLSQEEAIPYFIQLAAGCRYLYDNNVIHRDLKPSNVLLNSENIIKIADFGLSKAISEEIKDLELSNTPWIGTPLYMSPQVIGQENYSIKTDCWSLGCIFYEMLYGKTPWYNENVHELQKMIQNDNLSFPNEPKVSQPIKNLITQMLTKDENLRISIIQVQELLRY
ncbi:hypothetical protein pb186bvf_004014 [Paramecium bursaria]